MGAELVHIKQTHLLFGRFQPHVVMKKKVLKALQKRENLLPSEGSYLFSFEGYNNKSNGVRTTDAFSLVLVPIIVFLLVVLSYYHLKVAGSHFPVSDPYLSQIWSKRHFFMISTRV